MVIIEGAATGDIDVKRFYLPGVVIKDICKCGSEMVKDMKKDYFSYPAWGVPEDLHLYCRDCNTETKVKIKISCKLEVVLDSPAAT